MGQGEYKAIPGYKKAYVVGDRSSGKVRLMWYLNTKRADALIGSQIIIIAYDAFGYVSTTRFPNSDLIRCQVHRYLPQTLQAADITAKSVGAQVIMPDFFDGNTCDPAWFPYKEPEIQKKIQAWFGTAGNFQNHIAGFQALVETLKAEGDVKIGALGYCWGECSFVSK